MLRIKRVDRFCGWMSAFFLLISFLFAGCFARLETTQHGESQVDVQAISPLPTALATLPPESTPQPSPSPTFYWPSPPPAEVQTRAAASTVGPLPTAIPTRVIAKTVDLAMNLPVDDIFVCIVRRSDGRYEKYLIPIKPLAISQNFVQARDAFLNLREGDVVVDDYALATPRPREVPGRPAPESTSLP